MTLRTFLALITACVFCPPPIFAQHQNFAVWSSVASAIGATSGNEKLAAKSSAKYRKRRGGRRRVPRLDGKAEWFSRADDVFHAASTMKIPVMIELFHQAKQGKLKLDDS